MGATILGYLAPSTVKPGVKRAGGQRGAFRLEDMAEGKLDLVDAFGIREFVPNQNGLGATFPVEARHTRRRFQAELGSDRPPTKGAASFGYLAYSTVKSGCLTDDQ